MSKRVRFSLTVEFDLADNEEVCEPECDGCDGECDDICYEILRKTLQHGHEAHEFAKSRNFEFYSTTIDTVEAESDPG